MALFDNLKSSQRVPIIGWLVPTWLAVAFVMLFALPFAGPLGALAVIISAGALILAAPLPILGIMTVGLLITITAAIIICRIAIRVFTGRR